MSDLIVALREYLLDQPGVADVVATRIYPTTLPQQQAGEISGAMPALVIIEIDEFETGLESPIGDNGYKRRRLQVDCYAEDAESVRWLDRALNRALHGWRGASADLTIHLCRRVSRRVNPVPEVALERISNDYLINFTGEC